MYKSKKPYFYGTGRRKSSVARVHLFPNGTGAVTINGRDIDEYFGLETLKLLVRQPLVTTGSEGKFDIVATVSGGHSTYANGGVGGVVGQFGDGSIANSYNYGNVTLGEGLVCNNLGGVIGRDMKKSGSQVENVYCLDSSCAYASASGADERVTAVSAANCWPGVR